MVHLHEDRPDAVATKTFEDLQLRQVVNYEVDLCIRVMRFKCPLQLGEVVNLRRC
jgi:hypothetical protein